MKRLFTADGKLIVLLGGFLAMCVALSGCATVNTKNFAEGIRVMTGRGGTKEERDTIKEIVPDARDLSTYQPKPEWQTVFRADATDFLEFVSPDRFLVGMVQLGSTLAEPDFGGVELYDARTGERIWEGKRKNIPNGSYTVLSADPVILLYGASTKQLYFTALDPKSGQTLWEREVRQPGIASYDWEKGLIVAGAHTENGLELSALRVQDCSQAWSQTLPIAPPPKGNDAKPLEIATARDDANLIVAADQVFKIAVQTGEIVWKTENPVGRGAALYPTNQGLIVVGGNRLWMMDGAKGSLKWGPLDFKGEIVTVSAPGDSNATAFLSAREVNDLVKRDTIYGLSLVSGKKMWERPAPMPVWSPFLYVSGKLFFATGGSLECLDGRTGEVRSSAKFPPAWGWAPITEGEVPDALLMRGERVILASEKNGVAAFSLKDGKPVWRQPLNFFQGGHFWYATKEAELSTAAQMAGRLRKTAEEDRKWWSNWMSTTDYLTVENSYTMTKEQRDQARGKLGATMMLTQSLLAFSSALDMSLKGAAVTDLIKRKELELNNTVMLQARVLQGKYWVRPFNKRGTSVAIVDLDTGKRVDVQYSAPNIGMSVYGVRLPCIRISPDGEHFVTAEIGLDDTKFEKYVKFKWGMPYPSVLSYDLAKLQFRDTIWDDSDLELAAENGDLEKVKTLLKGGAWVDSRSVLGTTALTGAAMNGRGEVVRLLISSGADVNHGKGTGHRSAIEMAAYGGHSSIVKMLLDAGAEPGEAAQLAAMRGHGDTVMVFREAGLLQVKSLEDAISFGNANDVKPYVKDKKDADRPLKPGALVFAEGTTPLMLASYMGNLDAVRYLLDLGADVNLEEKTSQKENALMKASQRGNIEIAKLLIGKGADVNATDTDQMTALYKAARDGHTETVKLLLDSGAKQGFQTKIYHDTALIAAANAGHAEVVKLLLDGGANVNETDVNKETALIKAAWQGHVAVADTLLKAGADPGLKNKSGNTALDVAKLTFTPPKENKERMVALLEAAAK
jgi:ankyrin repeat protein/outer membrane protein assembly factor BamB